MLSFWRCWSTNFSASRDFRGNPHPCPDRSRRDRKPLLRPAPCTPQSWKRLRAYARAFYSLLAALLLAILLFYEVSGGMLTWRGQLKHSPPRRRLPVRDRVQRLSGLELFMICVLKLFLYDLRELETVNRIFSFIVLGLILVGVSWMYTRFRDRIQRYL